MLYTSSPPRSAISQHMPGTSTVESSPRIQSLSGHSTIVGLICPRVFMGVVLDFGVCRRARVFSVYCIFVQFWCDLLRNFVSFGGMSASFGDFCP